MKGNKSMLACIYGIKNNINNKYYIGQTINFTGRKGKHLRDLKNNAHHSHHLQRSYNKYGLEHFSFEIIEDNIPLEDLEEKENYYISLMGYYNEDKKGRRAYSEKALKNMSEAHIGQISKKRIMSKEQVFMILAINEFLGECQRPLSSILNCSRAVIKGIVKEETYRELSVKYNKLDLNQRIAWLEIGVKSLNYSIIPTQGGELYAVLVLYHIYDMNMSNAEVARLFNKTTRTIQRIINGEVLPKSREIYSNYNKEILNRVSELYYSQCRAKP